MVSPVCPKSQQSLAVSSAKQANAADKQEEKKAPQAADKGTPSPNAKPAAPALENSVAFNRNVVKDTGAAYGRANADKAGADSLNQSKGNAADKAGGNVFKLPDNAPGAAAQDAGAAGGYGGAVNNAARDAGGAGAYGAGGENDAGSGVGNPVQPGGSQDVVPGAGTGGLTPNGEIDRNINFAETPVEDRAALGLNDRDRAIDHLWGRQVISRGFQDGGIYYNVMQNPEKFRPAEVELVQQLAAQEQAQFGGINGKLLDQEFFGLAKRIAPEFPQDKIDQYMAAPMRFAEGPVNITSDVAELQQQTGLTDFQQASLRLWGHEPLFNGGKIDGSILAYTIGNNNALDSEAVGGKGAGIDNLATGLLVADLASDGVRNGDSLANSFLQTLDSVYLGAEKPTLEGVMQQSAQTAATNGRSLQQIGQDVGQGIMQAMTDAAGFVKDHPVISAVGAGGIAAASAVCPFLGGMGAGAAGLMAGRAMMNRNNA